MNATGSRDQRPLFRLSWANRSFLSVFVFLSFTFISSSAVAAVRLQLSWPSGWQSPTNSSSVAINTVYGAFSKGCPNYTNDGNVYSYYLDTGRAEHLGLDLRADKGTSVKAIANGTVSYSGVPWGSAWKEFVRISHPTTSGAATADYGHIDVSINALTGKKWAKGDPIKRGDEIGKVADLSAAGAGAHLHFGLRPGSGFFGATDILASDQSNKGGSGNCKHNASGTIDPVGYLASNAPAEVSKKKPKIVVKGNRTLKDGDTSPSSSDGTSASTSVKSAITYNFEIKNEGKGDLAVSAAVSGGPRFSLARPPATPVRAGKSARFSISFSSNKKGTFYGDVTLTSNDPDKPKFSFRLKAKAN